MCPLQLLLLLLQSTQVNLSVFSALQPAALQLALQLKCCTWSQGWEPLDMRHAGCALGCAGLWLISLVSHGYVKG